MSQYLAESSCVQGSQHTPGIVRTISSASLEARQRDVGRGHMADWPGVGCNATGRGVMSGVFVLNQRGWLSG